MILQEVLKKTFNIREGEFKISFLMQLYVFLIITSLLIIKPTVNSLFLSDLGVESLPIAFLWVAIIAYLSSYFYSKALTRFSLLKSDQNHLTDHYFDFSRTHRPLEI